MTLGSFIFAGIGTLACLLFLNDDDADIDTASVPSSINSKTKAEAASEQD